MRTLSPILIVSGLALVACGAQQAEAPAEAPAADVAAFEIGPDAAPEPRAGLGELLQHEPVSSDTGLLRHLKASDEAR